MYYLFTQHGLLPGDYYRLPAGDKVVIRAFWETFMGVLSRERRKRGNPRYDKRAIKLRR